MSLPQKQPVVSFSAVMAAGFASATAAVITSRFGVAGTLIGAALTSMIITGGSAIFKAYFERVTDEARKVPGKVRTGKVRRQEAAGGQQPNLPGRPDLRNNFMGRLRASLGWFSRLTALGRRTVLVGALIPALLAFGIGATAVTAMELSMGRTLSCTIWNKCPDGYAGADVPGVGLSILGGNRIVSADYPARPQDQPQDVQTPSEAEPVPAEPVPAEPVPPAATTPQDYSTIPEPTVGGATVP